MRRRAGLQFIPVIVRQVNDELTLQHALVENLLRDDLNPLEEAAAYQQLVEDFDLTQEEVAHKVGKSRSASPTCCDSSKLPPQVQRLVAEARVGGSRQGVAGHTRPGVPGVAGAAVATDGLSVRDTEEAVRQRNGLAGSPSGIHRIIEVRTKLRPPGLLELEELLAEAARHAGVDQRRAQARPGRHRVCRPRGPRTHLPGDGRVPLTPKVPENSTPT